MLSLCGSASPHKDHKNNYYFNRTNITPWAPIIFMHWLLQCLTRFFLMVKKKKKCCASTLCVKKRAAMWCIMRLGHGDMDMMYSLYVTSTQPNKQGQTGSEVKEFDCSGLWMDDAGASLWATFPAKFKIHKNRKKYWAAKMCVGGGPHCFDH